MMRAPRSLAGGLLLALLVGGCTAGEPAVRPSGLLGELYGEPRVRLMLIGDAGELDQASRILPHLVAEIDRAPERTGVVFLGDNAYPSGIPEGCEAPLCPEARALELQLDLAAHARGLQLFVPGNHDWGDGGILPLAADEGARRVEEERRRIALRGAELVPEPGCPGPAVRELGAGALRVVAMDSHWWLMSEAERAAAAAGGPCAGLDEATALAALEGALGCEREPCPPTILVAHHPLVTYGPHGGRFPWYRHLLPPIAGSLYVWLRQAGITRQDTSSEVYGRYVRAVGGALDRTRPLAFAAGHEHGMQVLQQYDGIGTAHLVTGLGDAPSPIAEGPATRYAKAGAGAIVLDVFGPRRVLVRVIEVDGTPLAARETYVRWIR